jgi:hypothetical protein
MGLVHRVRGLPGEDVAHRDDDTVSGWSPRARTMTVIGAALASWAVVGAIVYLLGAIG